MKRPGVVPRALGRGVAPETFLLFIDERTVRVQMGEDAVALPALRTARRRRVELILRCPWTT